MARTRKSTKFRKKGIGGGGSRKVGGRWITWIKEGQRVSAKEH